MAGTITGDIVLGWIGPVGFSDPDAPDGVREVEQLNLTIRAQADEKEYQCTIPADKAPTEDQCEQWQRTATKVTVFYSAPRVNVFAIDRTAKGADGKPKYIPKDGKKLTAGKTVMEVGSILTFQGYDVQPAGAVNLADLSNAAHGAYLVQQAEYRKRSVAAKKKRAQEQVAKKRAEAKKAG